MINVPSRTIFCHDNLGVLRGINSASVDLVYLDPPFNKKKKFTAPIGSPASGAEFSDIFRAEDVKEEWLLTIKEDHFNLHNFLDCIRGQELRGHNYNFCYLAYMAVHLLEIHRILKDTGSMYLHCDKTMCHYLKVVLDCIFGEANFRSHVIWHYGGGGASKTRGAAKHDHILHYSKSSAETDGNEQNLEKEEVAGEVIQMPGLMPWSSESTDFPTLMPLALLVRFIAASSRPGDMVLDPFCGCATTCIAAEKLGRGWIGIDVGHEAFDQVRKRAKKEIVSDLWDSRQVTFRTEPPARTDDGADANLLRRTSM